MNRFRQMLIGLLAIGAFAAVNVSSAAAVEFHSEAETTLISGSQSGTAVYTTTAGSATCGTATYSGTAVGKTLSSLALKGSVSECHMVIFGSKVSVTVSQNGCEGIAFPNGEGELVCPEGKNVVVTAPGCTITIPPQKQKGGTLTNTGNHIHAKGNATGIKYSHSGFTCGSGSASNGTITGETTVNATNTAGEPVKIWVE